MSQIKAGALISYLTLTISVLVTLLYTPFMIRLLGQAEYGLYALIGSLAAYLSIMDLGLGNSIIRFTARNRELGDKKAEANLNGLFIVFYIIIGLLTLVIGSIIYVNVDNIFDTSFTSSEIKKAKIMIAILTLNFAVSFPMSVFGAIIQAYEKFVITKLVALFRTIAIPIGTIPFLIFGFGSIAMVIISSIINISCLVFSMYYCKKNIGIKIQYGKIEKRTVKEILNYSFFVFLGIIIDQIYWNTDQFILGIVAGTIPVAVYAIAMLFIKLYMQLSASISGLFLPRVSIMVAKKVADIELSKMMIKYGRLQFVLISYILGGFTLYGQSFIYLWAGKGYENAYFIVLIIMIPLSIPLIQTIGISILYAKNLQGFRSLTLISISIINVIISIPLAREFGGIGTAFATAFTLILGNIFIMNIYYQKKIGLDMISFWKNIIKMSIPALMAIVISCMINIFIRTDNIIVYLVEIFSYSLIFLALIWRFGLNYYEKNLISSSIKILLYRMKIISK